MAVRSDSIGDRLNISSGVLDYNSAYTIMFFLQIVVDQNAITTFLVISDNSNNNADNFRTSATGTLLQMRTAISGTTSIISGSDLTVGTWYHIAIVRESATSCKVYLNGVLDITNTQDITGRAAAADLRFLGRAGTSDPSNCKIAHIKAWSTNLSQADIVREMFSVMPVYPGSMYAWWPCFAGVTERLVDWSGNGRTFTAAGTLTDEDGPPVSYLVRQPWFVPPFTAAAPATGNPWYAYAQQ